MEYAFLWLIFLGTILWVYFDAKAIGVKKGIIRGLADMNVGAWIGGMVLLWIVFFPFYLIKRGEFKKINNSQGLSSKKTLMLVGSVVGLSFLVIFLSGASNAAPDCNAAETKNTVIEIAKGKLKENFNRLEQLQGIKLTTAEKIDKTIKVSVENVRVVNYYKETGKRECAANLILEAKGEKEKHPIVYTSELMQDKKGQFYVTVGGI